MTSCVEGIKAVRPQFVLYADKPIKLGGKVERLAVEEFEKRTNIRYSDEVDVGNGVQLNRLRFAESITGYVSAGQLKQQVITLLKEGNDSLVICKMGEYGHGVFAARDIAKDTVLAIYAGTLVAHQKVKNREEEGFGYHGTDLMFSTQDHRGIASFLQHLPEKPRFPDVKTFASVLEMMGQKVSEKELKLNVELYSTEFSQQGVKEKVATENV